MSTKNTDPNALITLGDFSSHFAQTVDGFIALSDEAKESVQMSSTQIIDSLKSDPSIVELRDMSGDIVGFAIP